MSRLRCALLLGGLLALGACAATEPYPPVPPARAETPPLPPVSDQSMIWQPGYWDWTGNAYAWREGRWVGRAGHGSNWVPGAWAPVDGTYSWVPAHWI
jgi:hypothetical protein